MVRVTLPPMLRELYRRTEPVPVEVAATIGDLVGALEREFPGITGRLCEADGRLRSARVEGVRPGTDGVTLALAYR